MSTVKVYSNKEQTYTAAADLFADMVCKAVQHNGRCHVVLAGGETPKAAYQLLAEKPYCDTIPWQSVHIYWGDERCVPPADVLSNQQMARQSLLKHVPIPEENIHPIVYEGSSQGAAEKYENLLRSIFDQGVPQFDLILLGLGDDGHTASLFPNTDVLNIQDNWVGHLHLSQQHMDRVTLTFPVLNAAKAIVFLVTGAKKAHVVQQIVEEMQHSQVFPAQFIKPVAGEIYWLLDAEAASLLQPNKE